MRLLREMSVEQRVAIALSLSRVVDEAAMVGIRERHPGCTEREAIVHLAALKYGDDLVRRAYGSAFGTKE